ncbi:hypothetical protein FXF09_17685 [Vibrio cholerae]|uniref:hypothetical protein n=1 Tax=Vibrio cholerae TaxID=666 RepID=UPI0011D3C16B|nr:hypothetical protein [Vibrio cholerae]EMB2741125.1 hypothetical protein [Vibrio parahaemolyticus]EGQ8444999.1 hypothetical protein [Vibrio cholerae]EGQ8580488.1 hypothetical protein [Vibrio cholerae]EGQ9436267.1 hypothetical protein [Vibrio cholerae]EGR0013146.1 hypothetical protein [Vibrio cholerae]
MGWLSKVGGALLNCISKPVEVLCDWASEPLKSRSHDRSESARDSAHQRNMETLTAQSRSEHEIRTREMELESALKAKEKELDVNLEVRRVREIEMAVAEIQEWKKEKEFERMERTTAAIALYLEQLTKLNVETINAIGHMQLELKERAQQLVYEKTIQYKELQDIAIEEAMNDFLRIEEKFGDNERAKDILIRAVDTKMGNIIDTSTRFLEELNRDIVSLNQSIDRLTNQGQKFIENHLERFHITDVSSPLALAESNGEKLIPLSKDIN